MDVGYKITKRTCPSLQGIRSMIPGGNGRKEGTVVRD